MEWIGKGHGTWNGSVKGEPLVSSGFNYGVITNLSLTPAGKITGIKRIVSYNMRPVSGGGGMLFVGASDAVTNSQHNHIYTNLHPAGKITGIKRIVSYNMRPVSGGGGMLFVGASDAVTNSQHNHIYTNLQFILTSAPRTCYFEWDIEIEVE